MCVRRYRLVERLRKYSVVLALDEASDAVRLCERHVGFCNHTSHMCIPSLYNGTETSSTVTPPPSNCSRTSLTMSSVPSSERVRPKPLRKDYQRLVAPQCRSQTGTRHYRIVRRCCAGVGQVATPALDPRRRSRTTCVHNRPPNQPEDRRDQIYSPVQRYQCMEQAHGSVSAQRIHKRRQGFVLIRPDQSQ